MKTYRKGILSTALWIVLTATCHAQTTYTIIDLGVLPGGISSQANSINNSGQVVGESGGRAFFWSSGSGMQDLGTFPGGTFSQAFGINDSSQVVGTSTIGSFFAERHAFLWSSGSGMQDLGTLPNPSENISEARGINASGQLGSLQAGGESFAYAIDDSGKVVGTSGIPSGESAFLWSSGSGMQDLGMLPGGTLSEAFGINNSGQVVGYTFISGARPGFLWTSESGMQNLGVFGVGVARDINDSGQIVAGGTRAFLWSSESGLQDLSALPEVLAAGWTLLVQANAINNAGQIVGWGFINGRTHAFLLSPAVNHIIKLSRPDGSMINDTILDEIEPGKTTTLVARVYDQNNQLVPNVDVELKVDVVAKSGGHGHDDADRHNNYAGTLSPIGSTNGTVSDSGKTLTGGTDTAGLFFGLNSPAFPSNPAGDHFFTAKCTAGKNCTLKGPTQVGVGIKDLGEIPENLSLWRLVGRTDTHPKNHYVTLDALDKLIALANAYHDRFPNSPLLGLNDASLERGGLFDLYPKFPAWNPPHKGHRKGVIVDIRANGQADAIPQENFKEFDKLLRELGMSAFPEDLNRSNGHFHTRLLGLEQ